MYVSMYVYIYMWNKYGQNLYRYILPDRLENFVRTASHININKTLVFRLQWNFHYNRFIRLRIDQIIRVKRLSDVLCFYLLSENRSPRYKIPLTLTVFMYLYRRLFVLTTRWKRVFFNFFNREKYTLITIEYHFFIENAQISALAYQVNGAIFSPFSPLCG